VAEEGISAESYHVRFEVFAAVSMKIAVLCNVTCRVAWWEGAELSSEVPGATTRVITAE